MIINVVKIFIPAIIAFGLGLAFTPFLTSFLYKNKMWKKKAGKVDMNGNETLIFNALHKEKEIGTPRMGGIIIWFSALVTILGIWLISKFVPEQSILKLVFLSRGQTWIPLATLLLGAFVGLVDDYMEIRGNGDHVSGGLSLKKRLIVVGIVGLLCGAWFYFKLDVSSVGLPFDYSFYLGWLFIPFFAFVMMAVYSSGVIDGLDGLAGGIFATVFGAYAVIAFSQQQINLATFCMLVVGSILAFLWFNIPPARYYMSETGSMALTMTLAVVAFMTDSLGEGYGIIVLPIIAFPLFITSASVILQLLSKKFRNGKKLFKVAPIHHHFEAIGWPAYKVVMRFWIIGIIFAFSGVVLALLG